MVGIVIIFQPESRPEKINLVSFHTNEADELYFKNVRLFYYITREEGFGIFEVHRLKSIQETNRLTLPFAIYNNWRANEAFIRLDTTFSNAYQGAVLMKDSSGTIIPITNLPEADNISQYNFAKDTFKALDKKYKIGLLHHGKETWISESSSKSIRQCLKDYFKLVGKL